MIFTTLSGKKSVFHTLDRMCNDNQVTTQKGGSVGFSTIVQSPQSIHSCRTSLNSNKVRIGNILNTNNRFLITNSPVFDTLLDSQKRKVFKQGEVK